MKTKKAVAAPSLRALAAAKAEAALYKQRYFDKAAESQAWAAKAGAWAATAARLLQQIDDLRRSHDICEFCSEPQSVPTRSS